MILTVDRYDNLFRWGRISRGKAWLAGMLDLKPTLSFDGELQGCHSDPSAPLRAGPVAPLSAGPVNQGGARAR